MKNIHVISTNKPSRLYKFEDKLIKNDLIGLYEYKEKGYIGQNICITSDEKPKEGDWCLWLSQSKIIKCEDNSLRDRQDMVKKIILTDNKDLIKDGIQPINDEFLEWFVNNPSCEFVKIESQMVIDYAFPRSIFYRYKIIIPKEEIYFEFTGELDGLPTSSDTINYSLNAFKVPKEYFGKEEPKQETLEESNQTTAIRFLEWYRRKSIIYQFHHYHIPNSDEKYLNARQLFEIFEKENYEK